MRCYVVVGLTPVGQPPHNAPHAMDHDRDKTPCRVVCQIKHPLGKRQDFAVASCVMTGPTPGRDVCVRLRAPGKDHYEGGRHAPKHHVSKNINRPSGDDHHPLRGAKGQAVHAIRLVTHCPVQPVRSRTLRGSTRFFDALIKHADTHEPDL